MTDIRSDHCRCDPESVKHTSYSGRTLYVDSWRHPPMEMKYDMKNKKTVLFAVVAVMIAAVMIIAAGCGSSAGNAGNIPEDNTAAEDDADLPDPESGAVETAESEQLSSEEAIKETVTGSEDPDVFETEDSEQADHVVIDEGSDSISEYFTDEQLEHIRQALGIPDDLPVEVEVSSPYYWEGGGMDLVQVDFYHDGEYAAGAACKPYTEEIARNIYQYFE